MPAIKISGVDVKFPFKPYSSQIAMMCKIINALNKKENALIESPTGSGKTLALLCASIAWQQTEYKNIENLLLTEQKNQLGLHNNVLQQNSHDGSVRPIILDDDDDDDDDDFVEPPFKKLLVEPVFNHEETLSKNKTHDLNDPKVFEQQLQEARKSVPKIYFGSRTHKQLIQVIRELNRTEYKNVKMTILGSREQTCINKKAKETDNINESCKSLLRNEHGVTCNFYQKLKRYENNTTQFRKVIGETLQKFNPGLREENEASAWDMEDIVKIGEDQRFCPYFAATSVLMQDADVIFCPYSYLIEPSLDPIVREKIKLNLKGQIILFDEAHNIEDTCRDAVSFCVQEDELKLEKDSFDAAGKIRMENYPTASYEAFAGLSSNILRFINRHSGDDDQLTQQSHGTYYKMWSGAEICAQFKEMGLTEESLSKFIEHQQAIYDSTEMASFGRTQVNDMPKVSMVAVEQVLVFCRFLFHNNFQFMDDFKMGVIKQNYEVFEESQKRNKRRSSVGLLKPTAVSSLKIWCLNPAVSPRKFSLPQAFSDIGPSSWSIVLTSGTLSPFDTFESELGVPFRSSFRLETSHVLPPDRMFVRSIGRGPHNKPLRATYDYMFSNEFLDELGSLLLDVCSAVPRGVLCFLPSYKFLETIQQRWYFETGLWKKLEAIKVISSEPKNNSALKEVMTGYYEAVDNPSAFGPLCTGALFFAVYRGKISEGLDFADDYARVVVSVGIPYPNFKQIEVTMKREYNDKYCKQKKLLTGRQWYEVQAYRALNQALGRCLRHKNDWGSLLLVDERFANVGFQSKLSKWIRGNICHCDNFAVLINDLKLFNEKLSVDDGDSHKNC